MFAEVNRKNDEPFPEGEREYGFLLDEPVVPEEQEWARIFRKTCTSITKGYQLINYFLMRCAERDFEAARTLCVPEVEPDLYPELGVATLSRNVIDPQEEGFLCESLLETDKGYQLAVSAVDIAITPDGPRVTAYRRESGFPVSSAEAAMMLARSEFITVYELRPGIEVPDAESVLEFNFNTMVTAYDCGRLFITFKNNNDHVKKRVFRLSEDIAGMYFITDFGQFIVTAYDLPGIRAMEHGFLGSGLGRYIIPTARYEFKDPVLYDFINSGYDDFNDFLEAIRDE